MKLIEKMKKVFNKETNTQKLNADDVAELKNTIDNLNYIVELCGTVRQEAVKYGDNEFVDLLDMKIKNTEKELTKIRTKVAG